MSENDVQAVYDLNDRVFCKAFASRPIAFFIAATDRMGKVWDAGMKLLAELLAELQA